MTNSTESLIVIDTNVIVSAIIARGSTSNKAFMSAILLMAPCFSDETWDELKEVLHRDKLAKFFKADELTILLDRLLQIGHFVDVSYQVKACRDPKDDKFLSLALAAKTDVLMSGDQDLLVMNPFEGIHIVSPSEWLVIYANDSM